MIYFCIPAHNEERTVGVVLWKLRQVMAELQRDYQIIVVDDASTDSTASVLSPYIRVLPLTVLRNSTRRGYADSLELALREAMRRSPYPKRDAIVTLQADFTEDPDVMPTIVKRIEAGADIVATTTELEPGAPRSLRWGRRLFHWLLRKHEWAQVGDPLTSLRAYRVIVLKRALEARGTQRLLTWRGIGANAELLMQTVPVSRRNDVVETTLKQHRHQRDSRWVFLTALRDVRGVASGKPNSAATPLPTDAVLAAPEPIAVGAATRGSRHERTERPGRGRGRGQRGERSERSARGPRRERGERPQRIERGPRPERPERPKREKPAAPQLLTGEETIEETPLQEGLPARKRRRPRRRKSKREAGTAPELTLEQTETGVEVSSTDTPAEGAEAPRRKSRRGRRGGRGRRRGPRAGDNNNANDSGVDAGDAAPPMAAEGD